MKLINNAIALLPIIHAAYALRPKDTSICDYYTPIVTKKENSPSSQYELMLLITHTFILGNYSGTPNVGIKVAGVAAPANFDGVEVNLLNYFIGAYDSSNDGGSTGVAKNFLDSGGASALEADKPALSKNSNQYKLLTHVYQYFGNFYNCTHQGKSDVFPNYQGEASMFEVHKFMDLDQYEFGFFAQQIVLAAASVGFEQPDIDFTNSSLSAAFGYRCSPPAVVIPPSAGKQLQAICAAPDCPLDSAPMCYAYPNNGIVPQPAIANATLAGNVTKENETAAATTALWSSHCKRGATTSGCNFASSTAATASASTNGAGRSDGTMSVAFEIALTWVATLVGAGAMALFL